MNAKAAVRIALEHVTDLFEPEKIMNLGLEEVEFGEDSDVWSVTVGFSRVWDYPAGSLAAAMSNFHRPDRRDYKTVRIRDSDGHVLSVKNRPVDIVR